MTTDERISKVLELDAKATKPHLLFAVEDRHVTSDYVWVVGIQSSGKLENHTQLLRISARQVSNGYEEAQATAQAFVEYRTAAPELAREVLRLREENEQLKQSLKQAEPIMKLGAKLFNSDIAQLRAELGKEL